VRDGQDYETLAYRHYAWYDLVHNAQESHVSTEAYGTCHIRHHVLWWSECGGYGLERHARPAGGWGSAC
jgi:hypothetical protein